MSRRAPTLAETQRWLKWIFTEPRHAADALAAPEGEPEPRTLAWIADRSHLPVRGLSREAGLDVYRESYFARLIEALAKDFPAVRRIVGQENFEALVGRYLGVHPSRSPNIGDAGHAFPDFLAGSELASELPFLGDLARLEWNVIEAFHSEITAPLDPLSLRSVPESVWPRARVALAPSVRVLSTEWPIAALWLSRDSDEIYSVQVSRESRSALVHRENGELAGRIRVTTLAPEQARILSDMKRGVALGDLLNSSESAEDVTRWFSEWVSSGVISAVEFPD